MAKTNPKREAAAEQVKLMREAGHGDQHIRKVLKGYGLSEAQLNDLMPTTKPKPEAAPVTLAVVMSDERAREVVSECSSFLHIMAKRVQDPQIVPQLIAADLRAWAKKLEGLL